MAHSAAAAITDATAAVITIGCDKFATLDDELDGMADNDPVVVDGHRVIDRRDGITFEGLTLQLATFSSAALPQPV